MFWMILVVIVLVVGAAALVALGGGGSLPDADHDRLATDLPLERRLDPADVDGLRFPMALRGYRMDEVDDVLDRLAAELPQERRLNKVDIDELRLPMALRGYRMDEVDDVLDRMGAELTHRDTRIAELETALAAALDAPYGSEKPVEISKEADPE